MRIILLGLQFFILEVEVEVLIKVLQEEQEVLAAAEQEVVEALEQLEQPILGVEVEVLLEMAE